MTTKKALREYYYKKKCTENNSNKNLNYRTKLFFLKIKWVYISPTPSESDLNFFLLLNIIITRS